MGAQYCSRHKVKTFKLKSVFQTEDHVLILDMIVSARHVTLQVRIDAMPRVCTHVLCVCAVVLPTAVWAPTRASHSKNAKQKWFRSCFHRASSSNNATWLRHKLMMGAATQLMGGRPCTCLLNHQKPRRRCLECLHARMTRCGRVS